MDCMPLWFLNYFKVLKVYLLRLAPISLKIDKESLVVLTLLPGQKTLLCVTYLLVFFEQI